jgi:hypothetical protein
METSQNSCVELVEGQRKVILRKCLRDMASKIS